LWSRPSFPWATGVRPNSPAPDRRACPGAAPRPLQVGEQSGDRLVHLQGVPGVVLLQVSRAGPTCSCGEHWTNRTPASANRRAIRHCRPKFSVALSSIPYSFSVSGVSRLKSCTAGGGVSASGTPSRNDWMRPLRVGVARRPAVAVEGGEQVEFEPLLVARGSCPSRTAPSPWRRRRPGAAERGWPGRWRGRKRGRVVVRAAVGEGRADGHETPAGSRFSVPSP